MNVHVHICLTSADADLASPLLIRLEAPATGLRLTEPVHKVRFHEPDAEGVRVLLRERIAAADVIACFIGPATIADRWAEWEVDTGRDCGTNVVGVRLRAGSLDLVPGALARAGAQIVDAHGASVIACLQRAAFATRRARNK